MDNKLVKRILSNYEIEKFEGLLIDKLPGLSGTVATNALKRDPEHALSYLLGIQDTLAALGGNHKVVEHIRQVREEIKKIVRN